jgi:biotin carboxyl carrier protein
MKIRAELDGREYELDLHVEAGRAVVHVDERRYEIDFSSSEANDYLMLLGNEVFDSRVTAVSGNEMNVSLRNEIFSVSLQDPKKLRGSKISDKHQHGAAEVITQMPGKIVKVSVDIGTVVQKGDAVAVVEAMKMQNELKAPRAGTVVKVNVAAGDTIKSGDVLAVIED